MKEGRIYFSGIHDDLARLGRTDPELFAPIDKVRALYDILLSDAQKDFNEKFGTIGNPIPDLVEYNKACKHLKETRKKVEKYRGRDERIAITAKHIEDILTDFRFEKRTISLPEENSLDYVIYIREREGDVDVLAGRDLRTKKIGVRLYRIPKGEFDEWYGSLRTGKKHKLQEERKQKGMSWGFGIGTTTGLMLAAAIGWIEHHYGIPFSDILGRGFPMNPAEFLGSLTVVLGSVFIGGYIGGRGSYLNDKLVAKGNKALLHKSIEKRFMPQCRVPEKYMVNSQGPTEEENDRPDAELGDYVAMNAALIPPDSANL